MANLRDNKPKAMENRSNDEIFDRIDKLRRELQDDAKALSEKIDQTYLRIQVFESEVAPLKKFVYGIVGICMLAIITAILALVVSK